MGDFIDGVFGTDITGKKRAARDATEAQARAADQATQLQREMYEQNREDMTPWREAGVNALGQLTGRMDEFQRNFTMSDFAQDPGYQFRMDEGLKALERSAAARGNLGSGGTMKALLRYGQDFASNEYQNAYNRFNADRDARFNKLSSLAGTGQVATTQIGQMGQNYATQAGQNMMGAANVRAAAAQQQLANQNAMTGQIIGAGALAFSDVRLKEDIMPASPQDIAELRSAIKPYLFKYKDEAFGKGDWLGVMAQDIEKTKLGKMLVHENERGEKMIDAGKAVCLILATLGKE